MKYFIMCGGDYTLKFKEPKQLYKVNGEVLVERTIRLLRKNGVKNIAITTNGDCFDYLDVEIIKKKDDFSLRNNPSTMTSKESWLNAYYLIDEPCCYLHGDIYYSDEAIKKIVNTKVKDTMFFCVRDLQDGRPAGVNAKGREPLAMKVENTKLFKKVIKELFKMIDDGKFKNGVEPISWHAYRHLNRLDLGFNAKDYGFANNIFNTKGDYIVIDDYSTDIDNMEDITNIEKIIKIMKGELKMIKVEVVEDFTLGKFNELRNIKRANTDEAGKLFVGDTFECDEDMAKYLSNETKNPANRSFIKVIEVIPEEVKAEVKEEKKEEKKTSRRKVARKK